MRNIFFFILFVFVFIEAFSQKVQIVDSQTEKPIDNVFIYNLDKTIQTKSDFNGMVDLSIFNRKDLINFQHPSYHHFTAQVEDLLKVEQVLLTERIIEIGEVVISANKWEQNGEDIPNSIAIVNSKAINFENPQTSADVLELTGKVFVQKSQLGGGSPMLRGFAANSVLIIVDGVRVNNAIFRSGNLQNLLNIDPLSLSSAEVIFGPGSVIYGSDALGGIMDFHTIKPVFSPDSNKLSGTTNLRYSSANNEITSHLNLSYSTRKLSLFSAFTYSDFDDLRAGAKRPDKYPELGMRKEYIQRIENRDSIVANKEVNKLIHSGFSQYSTINKLNYKVSENMEINYGFYYSSTSDVPRYDRLIQYKNNTLRSAEWYYGPQIWMRNNLGLKYYGKRKLFDEFKSIIAFQQFEESRHTRDYQDIIKTSRYENVSVLSLNMDLNKELNDKTFLFYGIEGITNRIKSNAFSTDITTKQKVSASTRYPDGGSYYHSWAGYISMKHKISQNQTLTSGIRYSKIALQSNFEDKTFFDFPFSQLSLNTGSLNGSLGYVYSSNGWKLDLLASSGFRAPNIDDIGKIFDSEPGNVVVPNPDLSPEYVYTGEVGVKKDIRDKISIEFNTFYSFLKDVMVRRNFTFQGSDSILFDGVLSRVQALVNAEQGIIYGATAEINAEISPHFAVTSTYSIIHGNDSEGLPLRHVTPDFGRTSVQYKYRKLRIELFLKYQGAIPFEDLAPSEQNKAYLYTDEGALAWKTWNIKSSFSISSRLNIYAGIENLFDLHYIPYSSGISAPGRNYILSSVIKF